MLFMSREIHDRFRQKYLLQEAEKKKATDIAAAKVAEQKKADEDKVQKKDDPKSQAVELKPLRK